MTEEESHPAWIENTFSICLKELSPEEQLQIKIDIAYLLKNYNGKSPIQFYPERTGETFSSVNEYIRETFFDQVGFDPYTSNSIAHYNFKFQKTTIDKPHLFSQEGLGIVFETNLKDKDCYLHFLLYPDLSTKYLLAPAEYRLG